MLVGATVFAALIGIGHLRLHGRLDAALSCCRS